MKEENVHVKLTLQSAIYDSFSQTDPSFPSLVPNKKIKMNPNNQVFDLPISVPSGGTQLLRTGFLILMDAHIGVDLIAGGYLLTTMIGPGALSLPWAVSHLGWIISPFVLIFFSITTYYTVILQAACISKTDCTYMDAVRDKLGVFQVKLCEAVQVINCFFTAIGYTIASSTSMMAIMRSDCLHARGHDSPCKVSKNPSMIAVGVVQIILSQISDFDEIWWLPIVSALMSFIYPAIGLGLEISKVIKNGNRGSLTGVRIGSAQKIWTSFQAVGAIAFAYSIIFNLNEIRERIKSPASDYKKLEKAGLISVAVTSVFKILCAFLGYAAFGDASPENLLTGFGFYNPYWLVNQANAAVVVHLLIAYQVICQPLFASVEKTAQQCFPDSKFVTAEIPVPIPGFRKLNLFRLFWRTIFVIITTCMAMLIPFFNDVVGILGALRFWPLTVYFPVEIYIRVHGIGKWSRKWIGLQTLSAASLIVSILAALGSVAGLVSHL